MKLSISLAPHVRGNDSVRSIMLDVIIALFPATAFGVYLFGLRAAVLIFLSILSAVLAEYAWQRLSKREVRVGDLSAGYICAQSASSGAVVDSRAWQRVCYSNR